MHLPDQTEAQSRRGLVAPPTGPGDPTLHTTVGALLRVGVLLRF